MYSILCRRIPHWKKLFKLNLQYLTSNNFIEGGYDIPASGKKARWTASMIFTLSESKITSCIKEWDKLSMWKQLGWPIEHATDISRLQTQS